jgi:hypothetical protein
MSTIAEFALDLQQFGLEVEADAERVFRAASQVAAEAVVVGNQFGPGAPVDTGFLRASFRVGIGAPQQGPTEKPPTPGRRDGAPPLFAAAPTAPALAAATLDRAVYVTTSVVYAEPLEYLSRTRRFGPYAGRSTAFVRPVELRWPRIVADVMRRLRIGDPGASST